jgi:hypothetical protein
MTQLATKFDSALADLVPKPRPDAEIAFVIPKPRPDFVTKVAQVAPALEPVSSDTTPKRRPSS